MTLLREIMLVVVLVFVALFGANFTLTVLESRNYLETQMQAHAQDTATSLGLSMTTALSQQDTANLELLASAVFDRGYYSEIRLTSIDGEVLVQRQNAIQVDDVPAWFVALIDLPKPEGRSEITRGWLRLGELKVTSHPGNAYRDLWRLTVDFAYLFAGMVLVSYALLGIVVGLVMRPLKEVEAQANDICDRQFAIVEDIPRTRELKSVVEAMNRMSAKVKTMFENQVDMTEQLREEVKTDPLTGLINKTEFSNLLEARMQSVEGPGPSVLMLLQVRDFALVNEKLGFAAADDLLIQVANRLKEALSARRHAVISRRNGADFAVFIPGINLEHARISLQQAFQSVASLQVFTDPEHEHTVHMSGVYSENTTSLSALLTDADAALRNAQAAGDSGSEFVIHGQQENPITEIVKQAQEWRETLTRVIEDEDFLFHYQPIYRYENHQPTLLANEIFVRIELEGRTVSAGTFIPMAERFGLLVSLDQLIIERALSSMGQYPATVMLNLSTYSLQSETFISWLKAALTKHLTHAPRVIFELQEHAVHLAYHAVEDLIGFGNALGYRFSVDHFGTSRTSFAYLERLDLTFIKIDRQFVDHLDEHTDHQFFIRSVVQIAKAREMLVIAEGVEREEELNALQEIGVDAAMGYLLGRPGPEISLT